MLHLVQSPCNNGFTDRGKYFDVVEKHIDCDEMFRSDFIEGWKQDASSKHAPRLQFLVQ